VIEKYDNIILLLLHDFELFLSPSLCPGFEMMRRTTFEYYYYYYYYYYY